MHSIADSSKPQISYLVSTYDAGHYLDRHVGDMIRNQSTPYFQIVIVNPNSPGTDDLVAKKWAEIDDRVKYIYHPEREPYGASWLRAWKASDGDFVCNSNTDDFHSPQFTYEFYKTMRSASINLAFFYSGLIIVREPDMKIVHSTVKPPYDRQKFKTHCMAGPQVAWRNSRWFKEKLDWGLMEARAAQHTSAFDYWLWLYFMSLGFNGYAIQQILTIYTQRKESIENRRPRQNTYESLASISEFFPDAMPSEWPEFRDFNNLPEKEQWIVEHS
jgi:glycosyltransferase involved in cell wall biosynthesis